MPAKKSALLKEAQAKIDKAKEAREKHAQTRPESVPLMHQQVYRNQQRLYTRLDNIPQANEAYAETKASKMADRQGEKERNHSKRGGDW